MWSIWIKSVGLSLGRNKLRHIHYLHQLWKVLMKIRCGIFDYIFDMQWIINVPTVCSRIASHICCSILFHVLLILYAGISRINFVSIDSRVYVISGARHSISFIKEYTVLLEDDVFRLMKIKARLPTSIVHNVYYSRVGVFSTNSYINNWIYKWNVHLGRQHTMISFILLANIRGLLTWSPKFIN